MVKNNTVKKKILSLLMKDSRKSYRTIANELGISTTTVSRIVKDLEASGVIQGYTTIVDWHKLGYDSTLCLQVSISPNVDIDSVGSAIRKLPAVKQVFYTTGDSNFSAYAVCLDTSEAASLLEKLRKINGVDRVVPHTVLKMF